MAWVPGLGQAVLQRLRGEEGAPVDGLAVLGLARWMWRGRSHRPTGARRLIVPAESPPEPNGENAAEPPSSVSGSAADDVIDLSSTRAAPFAPRGYAPHAVTHHAAEEKVVDW